MMRQLLLGEILPRILLHVTTVVGVVDSTVGVGRLVVTGTTSVEISPEPSA